MRVIKINLRKLAVYCLAVITLCTLCSFGNPKLQAKEGVALPVIMYHHISEDKGALNDYVISPGTFEEDIKFLKEKGYEFVLPRECAEYVREGKPLPEKPVMITFDDGFESVYHYAFPLCEKYGLKFTLAVLGHESEFYSGRDEHNISYSYVTWDEIRRLNESGMVEIANHTFNMHETEGRRGINKKKEETEKAYNAAVSSDILKLQQMLEENSGVTPETFVYPYGFTCEESVALVKNLEFSVSFSCWEGMNYLSDSPERLYCMRRYNRPHGISSEKFFGKLLNYEG